MTQRRCHNQYLEASVSPAHTLTAVFLTCLLFLTRVPVLAVTYKTKAALYFKPLNNTTYCNIFPRKAKQNVALNISAVV